MEKIILVVEDELTSQALLAGYLEQFSYKVLVASTLAEANEIISQKQVNAILMDLELPDGNGLELAEKIRQVNDIPIIFVSQSKSDDDKLKGLEIGGDDYISKPYNPKELELRLRNILKRAGRRISNETENDVVLFGGHTIDFGRRTVKLEDGKIVHLTRSEFRILEALVLANGRALCREQLLQVINLEAQYEVFDRTVDVLVSRIRKKLGEQATEDGSILTVSGYGYRLNK